MSNFVIGFEGDVGAGKTSICKELVNIIDNTVFVDAGDMARAIVMVIKKNPFLWPTGLKLISGKKVDMDKVMNKIKLSFTFNDHDTQIYVNGKQIPFEKLQTRKNGMGVSKFTGKVDWDSLNKFVSDKVNEIRKNHNVILAGRGLVDLYHDLTCHVFVTADLKVRVERRYNQYEGTVSKEKIEQEIVERDRLHEESGFNKTSEKTVKVDVTNCQSAKEATNLVINVLKEHKII